MRLICFLILIILQGGSQRITTANSNDQMVEMSEILNTEPEALEIGDGKPLIRQTIFFATTLSSQHVFRPPSSRLDLGDSPTFYAVSSTASVALTHACWK